ncbi:SDR family oxidoreductase [Roseateles sp. DB2]|uniref:SDR family oxidoreductase n=1 Tax=Roseateles sp. DB2 TaxID=3453717 RepID=UPI003EE9C1CF
MSQAPLVYITGASSGLGQAMALEFYQQGWRLALVARRTEELARWSQDQGLEASRLRIYGADVSQVDSIVEAGRRCIAEQGLPDVVIANAGISVGMDTAIYEDLAVMQRVYATNNIGAAATFHPFIAPMNQRGSGSLVGIASVAGIRGLPGHAAYCSSKAAVISYCESLRGECRPFGVRVTTIVPGYIDTPLTRRNRYHMPFLMSAGSFARAAYRSIQAGDRFRVIPWQMGMVARLLRLIPNALYDRLLAGRPRKHREGE